MPDHDLPTQLKLREAIVRIDLALDDLAQLRKFLSRVTDENAEEPSIEPNPQPPR